MAISVCDSQITKGKVPRRPRNDNVGGGNDNVGGGNDNVGRKCQCGGAFCLKCKHRMSMWGRE